MTLSVTLFKVDRNSPALRPSGMTHILRIGNADLSLDLLDRIKARRIPCNKFEGGAFSQNAVSTSGFSRSSRLVPEFANFGLTSRPLDHR